MTYNRNRGGEGMGINERFGAENVEEPQAPPAWLTAAVLAALPGDGTPRDLMGIHNQASIAEYPRCRDKVPAVLAHLVSTGEIEAIEGGAQWRRWGVPEGWAWARMAADNGDMLEHDGDIVADVGDDGRWAAFPATPVRSAIEQHEITRGRAETPAAARQAALRACYERGVFGPRPAPTLATSTPQGAPMGEQGAPTEDRPSRLRAALLSVLSRGPVEGLARLLPALDAAMGESPGVARVTGAEARRAAAEVGAVVDGARWVLPAMVPGWGWRLSYVPHCLFLARLDAADVEGGAVATVESANGAWGWQLVGAPAWSEADSLADGQAAALTAARLAGLFAPRPAAGDGGLPALPAVTALDGSAVVPQSPLDALLALLSRVSGGPLDHDTQTAAGAFVRAVVAEARPPLAGAIAAVGEQDGTVTTRVAEPDASGRVASAERAAAEARLEAEAAERRAAEAERERDAARSKLATIGAEIDALHARWAGAR